MFILLSKAQVSQYENNCLKMIYQSQFTNFLMHDSNQLFTFFPQLVQSILFFKKLRLCFPTPFSLSRASKKRSNIFLLHNLMNILVPASINNFSKHTKVTIAESTSCLYHICALSLKHVNETRNLCNIKLLIFFYHITGEIN